MLVRNAPLPKSSASDRYPDYNGPADGKSHVSPWALRLLKPPLQALFDSHYKVEIEGREHLTLDRAQLIAPTHLSSADPPLLAACVGDDDLRTMAAKQHFKGLKGIVMRNLGAFPVDRGHVGHNTVKHAVELLREGKRVAMFPEGGIPGGTTDGERNENAVGPLRPGSGAVAVMGKADSILPVVIHYQKQQATTAQRLGATAVGAATAAAGTIAGCFGSPLVQTITGAVTGALCGGYVGTQVAHQVRTEWWDQVSAMVATVKGAVLGGALGGIAGGLIGARCPQALLATSVGAGLAGSALVQHAQERDTARVVFCPPLPVDEFVQKHGRKDGADKLTEALHASLAETKARLVRESAAR